MEIMTIKPPSLARTKASGTTPYLVMAEPKYATLLPKQKQSPTQKTDLQDIDTSLLQADSVFSGISTFGRLPYFPCLASDQEKFDIAFLGR
jgi:hypothetical protein